MGIFLLQNSIKAVISGNLKSKLYILSRVLKSLNQLYFNEYFGFDGSKSNVNQNCNTTSACSFNWSYHRWVNAFQNFLSQEVGCRISI